MADLLTMVLTMVGTLTLLCIVLGSFHDPDKRRRQQIRRIMDKRNATRKGPLDLNKRK